jgi:serine/threonine protein kinase
MHGKDRMTITRNDFVVGDTVDRRYRLRRELGRGGMSTVFEATHIFTGRRVAVKVVAPGDRALRERLLREASVLGQTRHPSIVEVLDAGDDVAGRPFMAMELLEGRSLEGLLAARRTLAVPDVVDMAIELCDALGFVHERRFIHRDIKPGNVFLVPDASGGSRAKLIDFGIVAVPDEPGGGSKLTGSEQPGTPEYMSPEHLRDQRLDGRADLYSLAITMFECLTGEVPFTGSYGEVVEKIAQGFAAPSLRVMRPDVPVTLAEVIDRALAQDREARFPDAAALGLALRKVRETGAAPARSSAPVEQRRTYARAPYVTPVRLLRKDHEPVDGRSEDISEGGLFILADRAITAGEQVTLRFALPTSGMIAQVVGSIRWIRPARGGKAALGFEFSTLADEHRRSIAEYVRWLSPSTTR